MENVYIAWLEDELNRDHAVIACAGVQIRDIYRLHIVIYAQMGLAG